MPHEFEYEIRDPYGNQQYRRERSDGRRVTGSYGYLGPDGIFRHVDYIADEYGFRANIRTNETGVGYENPASVRINGIPYRYPSPPPPPPSPPFTSPPGRVLPPLPTYDRSQPLPPFSRIPSRTTPDYGQRDIRRQPRPPGTQAPGTQTPGGRVIPKLPPFDGSKPSPPFGTRVPPPGETPGYGQRDSRRQPFPTGTLPPETPIPGSTPGGHIIPRLPPIDRSQPPSPFGTRVPPRKTPDYGTREGGKQPFPRGTLPPQTPASGSTLGGGLLPPLIPFDRSQPPTPYGTRIPPRETFDYDQRTDGKLRPPIPQTPPARGKTPVGHVQRPISSFSKSKPRPPFRSPVLPQQPISNFGQRGTGKPPRPSKVQPPRAIPANNNGRGLLPPIPPLDRSQPTPPSGKREPTHVATDYDQKDNGRQPQPLPIATEPPGTTNHDDDHVSQRECK